MTGDQYVTLTLPAELAAKVEQAWQRLTKQLPHDMPSTEYLAIRAARHDAMRAACNHLANGLDDGLLMALAVSAAAYHRHRAALLAPVDGGASSVDDDAGGQAVPVDGRVIGQTRVIGGEVQQYDGQGWCYVGAAVVPKQNAIDEQPAELQGRETAELLAVLWHLCDEGQLPAALDSLLLGEYHHLRPVRADRPDMFGAARRP